MFGMGVNEIILLLVVGGLFFFLPLYIVYKMGVRKGRMMEMEKQLSERRNERGMV